MSKRLADGTISQTLGDEARGMVALDFDGHPQKYDQLEVAISLNASAKRFVLQCMFGFTLFPFPSRDLQWYTRRGMEKREVLRDVVAKEASACQFVCSPKNVLIFAVTRGERLES